LNPFDAERFAGKSRVSRLAQQNRLRQGKHLVFSTPCHRQSVHNNKISFFSHPHNAIVARTTRASIVATTALPRCRLPLTTAQAEQSGYRPRSAIMGTVRFLSSLYFLSFCLRSAQGQSTVGGTQAGAGVSVTAGAGAGVGVTVQPTSECSSRLSTGEVCSLTSFISLVMSIDSHSHCLSTRLYRVCYANTNLPIHNVILILILGHGRQR
jgi:hypothetical protein